MGMTTGRSESNATEEFKRREGRRVMHPKKEKKKDERKEKTYHEMELPRFFKRKFSVGPSGW